MMRRSSRLPITGVFASASLAGVLVATGACYGPTEVTLYITTEHACESDRRPGDVAASATVVTAIKVGAVTAADEPVAELNECTPRVGQAPFIGTLVVVPSDARDARVTVQVAMTTNGTSPQQCAAAVVPDFCIVARRSFAFIEHASLTLPIRLYEACRGVTCADEATTCGSSGKCEPASVTRNGCPPSQPDCLDEVDTPPDAGAEASADADADADTGADTGADVDAVAPLSCTGPAKDNVLAPVTPFPPSGGAGSVAPNQLASNKTDLFWTEPGITAGSYTRLMRIGKDGGGAGPIGQEVVGTAISLAASDTHVWVVTEAGTTKFTLGPAVTIAPLTFDAGLTINAVRLDPSSKAYFSVLESGGAKVVGGEMGGALFPYSAAVGGDLMAVGSTHLFTVELGSARRHLLTAMGNSPTTVNLGTLTPSAVAAYGSTFVVSYTGLTGEDGPLVRYLAGPVVTLGTAEAPGAIAVDDTSTFVLDHGKDGAKTATVRRRPNTALPASTRLPRITPLVNAVSGLAIDAPTNGCIYFIARDGVSTSLRVYSKATASLSQL